MTEPVFACAFVKQELMWNGIDGDEPVNMIFLLAIPPAEAGSTHMEVLTTLTSSLVEDSFREQLLEAQTEGEVMALFGHEEEAEPESSDEETPVMARDISHIAYPVVLGVGVAISALLFLLL
ncbi:PTS system [Vibrio sp. JCM 19236]|nr:PTS system [Vibrio sp. JCM 19236]